MCSKQLDNLKLQIDNERKAEQLKMTPFGRRPNLPKNTKEPESTFEPKSPELKRETFKLI